MPSQIRNVGIIAHVDHGKTTLVDAIFRQAGLFRANQHVQERVMDSGDLEREKGITILSKVASVHYRDFKINIVDTPGHVDFGGEVERVLSMVDGVLLVVDANEGPMPQTRFVLKKALANKLKPIVCINKIDREGARPLEAYDKTIDLFIDLGASEDDLFFPHLYTSGSAGFARVSPDGAEHDMRELFEMIVNAVPPPSPLPWFSEGKLREGPGEGDPPAVLQVNNLDYSEYLGRMFGGKLLRGAIRVGDRMVRTRCSPGVSPGQPSDKAIGFNVTKIWTYEGIELKEIEEGRAGEIVMLSGLDDVQVSDTLSDSQQVEELAPIAVEPPTLAMSFYANISPLAGKDGGKFLTIHKIRERLEREAKVSVALKIDETAPPETVKLNARGELQLAILIETMRREGYEMAISRPEVLLKRSIGFQPMGTTGILPVDSAAHRLEADATHGQDSRGTHRLEADATHGQDSRGTHRLEADATHGQDSRGTHRLEADATKGTLLEPVEELALELPDDSVGPVMEELSRRKAELKDMARNEHGRAKLIYTIPTRGLIGFRSNYLTLTRGEGLLAQMLIGYEPYRGEVQSRSRGSLIVKDPGRVTRYAYEDVQERGQLFHPVGTSVYGGMIVGECSRDEDMVINITKEKAATNMRSSTSDQTQALDPHKDFSLEQALAWIRDDELLEVTPKSLRFRKKILDHSERRVAERRSEVPA